MIYSRTYYILIYIKPLSDITRQFEYIIYHLYADDKLIYYTISRYIYMTCNDLSNCENSIYIYGRLNDNKLSLLTSKYELLNNHRNFDNYPIITINGTVYILLFLFGGVLSSHPGT